METPGTKSGNLKVWLYVWLGTILATIAVLPYAAVLQGDALEKAAASAGISVAVLLAMQVVQAAVLAAILAWIGLWAARRGGFTLHLLDALAQGHALPWDKAAMRSSILWGALSGAAIVALDLLVFAPGIDIDMESAQPAPWMGLLASFYGGITEEVLLRLFLLSLLALGLRRVLFARYAGTDKMPAAAFWVANIIAAVAFGLGHLPAMAALVPITSWIVLRALVLNGLLALVFGELYRRNGLEMAILAHFSADIVLHVITPMLA